MPTTPDPITASGARRTRGFLVSTACVVAVWAIIGLMTLSPDAVASGDLGVKFVQARSLIESRFHSMTLLYPGAWLDPGREFFPFRVPFVLPTPGGVQSIWPSFASVAQALVLLIGGMPGLVGWSIVSGALILWVTARIANAPSEWALPIALGLGTCLWFWAIAPWEHMPAVALTMAAVAIALGRMRYAGVLAGVALGLAAGLRPESLLLLPGVLLMLWVTQRRMVPLIGAVAALALLVLAAGLVDVQVYGRPPAAHAVQVVGVLRQLVDTTGGTTAAVPVLASKTLLERYDIVVHYWLVSPVSRLAVVIFLAACVGTWLAARWTRSSAGVLALTLVAGAWATHMLWLQWQAPRWVAGLFGLSPFLVFALLPAPGLSASVRRTRNALIIASVAFVGIAILTTDTSGGKAAGGPRFLLPVVPLLAIAAWQAIVAYRDAGRVMPRVIGWAGCVLVAMSVVSGFVLLLPPFVDRNQTDHAAFEAIRKAPDQILVATDEATAQLAMPSLYFTKTVLLADNPGRARSLGSLLEHAGWPSALVLSRGAERPGIVFAPYRIGATETYGRMIVQRWVR